MRCKNCTALVKAVYFESYDPYSPEYCKVLDIEEDSRCNENEQGEYGCTLHYKTIRKLLKENNDG